jgi:6-phosphofructokinase 1/ribokinase
MKFLAFFGHLNIDVSISVNTLPKPGEAQGIRDLKEQFAGTAGNFAYVANSLGLEFDLYSVAGGSSHIQYIEQLKKLGIDIEHVNIIPDKMGPICYIPSDGREQMAYMFQGPMDDWEPSKYFSYNNYKYINIGTGPVKEYMKIVGEEKSANITFDPGQEIWYTYSKENAKYMVDHSHMIIMNKKEFDHLKEMIDMDDRDINRIVKRIVITDGANGAMLMENGSYLRIPGFPAEHVNDTVGAGDSFRAGLYTALYHGMDIKNSIMFGNITAARAIENNISQFHLAFQDVSNILSGLKM